MRMKNIKEVNGNSNYMGFETEGFTILQFFFNMWMVHMCRVNPC